MLFLQPQIVLTSTMSKALKIKRGVDIKLVGEAEKILTQQIPDSIKSNVEAIQWILNSDKENAKITSDEQLKKIMSNLMFTQTGIFKKFSNDEAFRKRYQDFIFDLLWSERKGGSGKII